MIRWMRTHSRMRVKKYRVCMHVDIRYQISDVDLKLQPRRDL
jgi:hypothetical protein